MSFFNENKFLTKIVLLTIFLVLEGGSGYKLNHEKAKREIVDDYPVLLKVIRENSTSTCSGIPLSKQIVLTSATCVNGANTVTIYGDNERVNNIFEATNATTSEIIIHPEYLKNPNALSPHNIAILHFPFPNDIKFKYGYTAIQRLINSTIKANFVARENRWIKSNEEFKIEESIVTMRLSCSDNSELLCGVSQNANLCNGNHGEPLWFNGKLVGIAINAECSESESSARYVNIANNRKWIIEFYVDYF